MLLITGTFRLPPERIGEAREPMARMIAASRAEEGCEVYAYAVDLLDPGLIHVTERWRDRATLAAHARSAHIVAWQAERTSLGFADRALTVYDVDDGRPA